MKRCLAVLLAVIVLFVCFPVIPGLAEKEESLGYYTMLFNIGSKMDLDWGHKVSGYLTKEEIEENDLFNDDGDFSGSLSVIRIELYKDITTNDFPHYQSADVEINLNGHTWTVTDMAYTRWLPQSNISISGGTLTFKNKISHPIHSYEGGVNIRNVTFKDCECGSYGIIYVHGDPYGAYVEQDDVFAPCSIHLDNVTFENCSATSYGACVTTESFGREGTDSQFNNCKFINCHSADGGALHFERDIHGKKGKYHFVNCEFTDCYASSDGGAIYSKGDYIEMTFRKCDAYHCNAGGDGGFIFIAGANTVCNGNGNASASTMGDRSNIVGCYALDDGGAIYSSEASGNSNYSEIKNFNMISNTAGASRHNYNTVTGNDEDTGGGAVFMGGHHMKVSYCDFYDNYADEEGGAIYCGWNNSTIENCSFAENRCEEGNDIYVDSSNNITVKNCIIKNGSTINAWAAGGGNVALFNGVVRNCTLVGGACSVDTTNIWVNCGGSLLLFQKAATAAIVVENCLITGCNTANRSGSAPIGLYGGVKLVNCTVAGNDSNISGGTMLYERNDQLPQIVNCAFFDNTMRATPASDSQLVFCRLLNYRNVDNAATDAELAACFVNCAAPVALNDTCLTTDAPLFADAENGDYRLTAESPLLNAGYNTSSVEGIGLFDLIGSPRFVRRVDIGCFEYREPKFERKGSLWLVR